MVNTNTKWFSMSDKAIIASIGEYLKTQRIAQNKTQAKLAEMAGINRWTLSKVENGDPISLISLIQILRALELLDILDVFKIQHQISPLELAKIDQQKRQRARSNNDEESKNESEW